MLRPQYIRTIHTANGEPQRIGDLVNANTTINIYINTRHVLPLHRCLFQRLNPFRSLSALYIRMKQDRLDCSVRSIRHCTLTAQTNPHGQQQQKNIKKKETIKNYDLIFKSILALRNILIYRRLFISFIYFSCRTLHCCSNDLRRTHDALLSIYHT